MMKNVKTLIFAGTFLALILPGCDKQERMDYVADPAKIPGKGLTSAAGERSRSENGISLKLVPESPTVNEDIEIMLRGTFRPQDILWQVNEAAIPEATGRMLPRKYFSRGDKIVVTVGLGERQVSAATLVNNSPPEIKSVEANRLPVHRGTAIKVLPVGTDADGDEVGFRFIWAINGEVLHWENEPFLAGDKFHKGDIVHLTVVPFDDESEGQPFRQLEFEVGDASPVFVSTPPDSFQATEFIYHARAVDPDGEEVRYQLLEGPKGMTIDGITGEIRWSISTGGDGESKVKIAALNPEGVEVFQEFSLQIQKGK